jgi:hypothetical protein
LLIAAVRDAHDQMLEGFEEDRLVAADPQGSAGLQSRDLLAETGDAPRGAVAVQHAFRDRLCQRLLGGAQLRCGGLWALAGYGFAGLAQDVTYPSANRRVALRLFEVLAMPFDGRFVTCGQTCTPLCAVAR